MNKILTLLIFTFILSSCSEEDTTPLTLNKGEYMNDLHKNNVGKIAFMNDWIAFDDFNQKDFTTQLVLNNDSDFSLRMFLGKTLTYYLHQLEPELSIEELCNKGNFQLTFYVDNKQVYQYNLQTGAGSCDYKNSATVYGIPLINKNNPDHWGRFMWMKFMKKGGGQQSLVGDSHQFKIEIRPYIKYQQLKVDDIIAQGEIDLITKEQEVNNARVAIQPIAATNKWQQSNASYNRDLCITFPIKVENMLKYRTRTNS